VKQGLKMEAEKGKRLHDKRRKKLETGANPRFVGETRGDERKITQVREKRRKVHEKKSLREDGGKNEID